MPHGLLLMPSPPAPAAQVKDIPVWISVGIIGAFGIFFIANYVSNVVEISNA